MSHSVIVAGARTPMGRLLGALSTATAAQLGATAIRGALQKSGFDAVDVDHVIMGQVLTAGTGQIPARQAAAGAGIPLTVPALTVNKVCLSGIDAIVSADRMLRCGDADLVVAGGQESMSRAPHMLLTSRTGIKYGDTSLVDHMAADGLHDSFTDQAMGLLTEQINEVSDSHVTRAEQDAFAERSHILAAKAWASGIFAEEVVGVELSSRRSTVTVERDEGIREDISIDSLATLRPAFSPGGTMTAGNASPISDGGAAVLVTTAEHARAQGGDILAEIVAHASVAGPDSSLQHQPAAAIEAACRKAGIDVSDLDVVEINEAFAAVGIASTRRLGIDPEKVNVNGGAIAMGHPLGMSGARIVLHLALELRRRGGGIGAAALCGGGGQGDAIVLRVN
ncbi:acetyl-CoA C-acyltransferase [Gordonia sp. N1V]|uniref:acetyl-CoA C-acyltransferase n=1 Tax=Gordonia sp. N1V TaxID=3034163 RepID=UPI0023E0FD7C|nr:acetyl-CoA C-acyltransferase [Gordonia sp. N1V]MDF3281126.1 acetyl-CoA C-acyltransferase [Gordonia sp. N1V]